MRKNRADWILKWVRGPAVLDVGCTGHKVELASKYWVHGRLRQSFSHVVGIDVSEEKITQLQQQGFENLYVQSAETFSLNEQFDTIVAGELIEHLAKPGNFLIQARKHMKQNGRLILTTPYPFSIHYSLYALWKYPRTCQNIEHTCWFCPQTIRELAQRCGFDVQHFELISDYRPENNPSLLYRLMVHTIIVLAPLLPDQLKHNTMLVVLVPHEDLTNK